LYQLRLLLNAHNSLFCDDYFHRYVMLIDLNWSLDQLEIMAKTDQMSSAAGVVQKPVVKTFSVADPVTGQVEGNAGDNNKINFIDTMLCAGRSWFQNAKGTLLQ